MNDIDTTLQGLTEADPAHLAVLRAALGTRAADEGVLDVAFREYDSPVGRLMLAATERGVVRVAYETEGFDAVLATLSERVSPRVLNAPRRLDPTVKELDEYFAGRRTAFDLPLDRAMSSGFRLRVQQQLASIGYGRTASYKDVAALVGNPNAVRAVGTACATNPLPVIVPCHRVLRSDGSLGGYLGGPGTKSTLLALEREAAV